MVKYISHKLCRCNHSKCEFSVTDSVLDSCHHHAFAELVTFLHRNAVPMTKSSQPLPSPGSPFPCGVPMNRLPQGPCEWGHTDRTCSLLSGSPHWAWCHQGSSMLRQVSEPPPFKGRITVRCLCRPRFVYLSTCRRHLVASTFWLLWLLLLWTGVQTSLPDSAFSSLAVGTE